MFTLEGIEAYEVIPLIAAIYVLFILVAISVLRYCIMDLVRLIKNKGSEQVKEEDLIMNGENAFVVALVYQGKKGTMLRHAVLIANSKNEALGDLIERVREEAFNYSLICSSSVPLSDFYEEDLKETPTND
jgi:hypothetical protein